MTTYAVTVSYTGDILIDADTEAEAWTEVEQQLPHRTPDSDWYYTEVVSVRVEREA